MASNKNEQATPKNNPKQYLIVLDVYGDVEIRTLEGEMLEIVQHAINEIVELEEICYMYSDQLKLGYLGRGDIIFACIQFYRPQVTRKRVSKIKL